MLYNLRVDEDEKVSVDHIQAREVAADYIEGSEAEKRLLRKLDYRLIVSSRRILCELEMNDSKFQAHVLTSATAMLLDPLSSWLS